MLLRRVRHHVANENWFAVFVDFVIVVVGVYVGIEVSNWNEARQEDQRSIEYLERIRADLVHDRRSASERRRFWTEVREYGEAAIKHAETGELRLIRNAELRTRLADYYVYATSLQAEHLFQLMPRYREYVRGAMPHAIQRHVWAECHHTDRNLQNLLNCELPIDELLELVEASLAPAKAARQ